MLRLVASILLIALLASCPIVCGTAHAASCDRAEPHPASDDASGFPTPANDDDCLCNGALKAGDADRSAAEISVGPLGSTIATPLPTLLLPLRIVALPLASRRNAAIAPPVRAILRC